MANKTGALKQPTGTCTARNEPNIKLIAESVIITFKNGATTVK